MAAISEYMTRAEDRIMQLLTSEHALVHPEVMARLSEAAYAQAGTNIDPHHVTTALGNLSDRGAVRQVKTATRGGRAVTVIRSGTATRSETRIEKASARKRVLLARYNGWAQGTRRYPHGTIGPAGETAARSGLVASGALQFASPQAGPVATILGTRLQGPADSGGYLTPLVNDLPQPPVTVLIEVKNIRSWIYPTTPELYQLLRKCAHLKAAHPGQPVVGVLICRRAHKTLFWMAKQLGFAVIELERQFAGAVDLDALNEVRNELFFPDLRQGTGPSLRVRDRFESSNLPAAMPRLADAWSATTVNPHMTQAIESTRGNRTQDCLEATYQLRALADQAGLRGGW